MTSRSGTIDIRARFWETVALDDMSPAEWEALCDGCGRCCLLKIEDDDGEVSYTNVSCRLLDTQACRCGQYALRRQLVKGCVVLTPDSIGRIADWMPDTCAYRLLFEGRPLEPWHPLISGDPDSVHTSGVSVRGWAIPEYEVDEQDLEDHILAGKSSV